MALCHTIIAKMGAGLSWQAAQLTSATGTMTPSWLSAIPGVASRWVDMMGRPLGLCWFHREAPGASWQEPECVLDPRLSQVMTDLEDKNEWKNCIDITGVRLPTGYYFGASAGTGDLSGE